MDSGEHKILEWNNKLAAEWYYIICHTTDQYPKVTLKLLHNTILHPTGLVSLSTVLSVKL